MLAPSVSDHNAPLGDRQSQAPGGCYPPSVSARRADAASETPECSEQNGPEGRDVLTTIRTGENRHNPYLGGGVDRLVITVYGVLGPKFAEVAGKLREMRRRLQEGETTRETYGTFGGEWDVAVSGARFGGRQWAFRLESEGITIGLTGSPDQESDRVAFVDVGSVPLTSRGHESAWRYVKHQLAQLGIEVRRTSVARIDLCNDFPGLGIEPFYDAIMRDGVITRASAFQPFFKKGQLTGLQVGTRGNEKCMLRVYDKVKELQDKPDEAKEALVREMRWAGTKPKVAARVEFEVGGAWLRGKWKEVSTVEEVFEALPVIMEYLLNNWVRFIEGSVDRENGHQKRARVAEFWQAVEVAFLRWLQAEYVPLERPVKKLPEQKNLRKQAAGVVLSYASMLGKRYNDLTDVMREVSRMLYAECESKWEERIKERRAELTLRGYAQVLDLPPPKCPAGCGCRHCAAEGGRLF